MKIPAILALSALATLAAPAEQVRVRLSWGHRTASRAPFYVRLAASQGEIRGAAGYLLEPGEEQREGAWRTRAGGGDVDGVDFTLGCAREPVRIIQNLHIIWADLIANSDPDTARRLSFDPAFRIDGRKLTVEMNPEGTKGFTVTVDQLLEKKALWVPSLDVFLAVGERPVSFAEHQRALEPWKGRRVLDQVHNQGEASYDEYASRWEDMGSAAYVHPVQPAPGHVVCLAWDSSIHKFGVDRGAGAWNDYGNPDRFRFWYGFGDLAHGIAQSWRSQRLDHGLPVISTVLESAGVRYEVEQFAFPLHGPPAERRGDIPMVLLQKVKLTDLLGNPRTVPVTLNHLRALPAYSNPELLLEARDGAFLFEDSGRQDVLFSVQGAAGRPAWSGVRDYQREMRRLNATFFVDLPARGSRELVIKLPSPAAGRADAPALLGLDYANARNTTLKFWSDYVERGAQFRVPEQVVNDLFRASLWHALRLPRRHGAGGSGVRIDLPYSNFAYTQTGTPWPVNQAVYVDYMLYDLRGYHDLSAEELTAIFRNNQEADGHLNGVANWLVYTPGMLYAVAKHYLLSGDRASFERLLPQALAALDWCETEVKKAGERTGPARGLVSGPLNDGTGSGLWAFNQAYLFAGLDLFGRALTEFGHPRAAGCLATARAMRQAIDAGFHAAAVRSPLVQLRDHTWIPYVPSEALASGRLLEQWYPTDVDTGALHLVRLGALPAAGDLAESLLEDHEDNLFLKQWGIANEPVYNQQATAYLLRDDPEAAIRAFYSFMASAFSHSALEPVEHRWTHGQYFGPPSTDGAWAELYRNMLVRETGGGTLWLGQAAPRAWLEDGKRIEVERAPTYYGNLSMSIESHAAQGRIGARIEMPGRTRPRALLIRLRHPERKPIRSVTVNGRSWTDFDPRNEWVRIPDPAERRYSVTASY